MMDTVLNLGLNDETVKGLIAMSGDERFAYDAYRRFVQMFSKIVLDAKADAFEHKIDEYKEKTGAKTDAEIPAEALKQHGRATSSRSRATPLAREFPEDPYEQLRLAIEAVFASWNNKRAIDYRNFNKIAHDLGTAVNVQTMVFGNMGDDQRDRRRLHAQPLHRREEALWRLSDQRAGRGRGRGYPQHRRRSASLAGRDARRLRAVPADRDAAGAALPRRAGSRVHHRAAGGSTCCRRARPSAPPPPPSRSPSIWSARSVITEEEALERVEPQQVVQLLLPRFDDKDIARAEARPDASWPRASTPRRARRSARRSSTPTAPRRPAKPASASSSCARRPAPTTCTACWSRKGILTSRGGTGSHAAVVARGAGPAGGRRLRRASAWITSAPVHASRMARSSARATMISIDGTTGAVYHGAIQTVEPNFDEENDLQTLLGWADEYRRLGVWANADYPRDAQRAVDVWRGGHRPLPHRAYVHGAGAPADRAGDDPRADARRSGRRRSTSCCPSSAPTSRASSARCAIPRPARAIPSSSA